MPAISQDDEGTDLYLFPNVYRKDETMQADKRHDRKDKPGRGPKPVTIDVNGQKVEMPKGEASGAEIKQAAIAQGVAIESDFSLFLRGKDGLEPIHDDEEVRLKKDLEFSAVAPDDVS